MSLTVINQHVRDNEVEKALVECSESKNYYLGLFLGQILGGFSDRVKKLSQLALQFKPVKQSRVKLLCNWTTTEDLTKFWSKMSKGGGVWNGIKLVTTDPVDYYVIINSPPPGAYFDPKKSLVFQMEPRMEFHERWGAWGKPDESQFMFVSTHTNGEYNNNEWHLSKSYTELNVDSDSMGCDMNIEKTSTILSTVLSSKYSDPGHIKRIDFIRFLEKKEMQVDIYGDNKWGYRGYKKALPYHCKDEAIFPYKYTFNAENHSIKNYFTEKLIDGILGECLVFYWGCPNIGDFIDPRAYVKLELSNFEKDYETIRKAIFEDWHSQRLPYIKEAKQKILNELQFFPRLEKIIYRGNK